MKTRYAKVKFNPRNGSITGMTNMGNGKEPDVCFSASVRLLAIELAMQFKPACLTRIWALQDGYGEPGFWPAQGYDWSGIRDSTDAAKNRMFAVAREVLRDYHTQMLLIGLPTNLVRRIVGRI